MELKAVPESFIFPFERKLKSAENYLSRIEYLHTIIKSLNQADTIDALFKAALAGVKPIYDTAPAALLQIGKDDRIRIKHAVRLSNTFVKDFEGLPFYRIGIDKVSSVFINSAKSSLDDKNAEAIFSREEIKAVCYIPFTSKMCRFYVLAVFWGSGKRFTTHDRYVTNIFADNLSLSLQRIQTLHRLTDSENMYRSIFDNSVEGIYQSSVDGRIITVNPALIKMFGYSSVEEMKKIKNTRNLYWDESERERLSKLVLEKGQLQNYEVKMKRKDGTLIIVQVNDRAVRKASGEIAYYEGSMSDITDRKLAEEALQKSESKYRTIFENVQDVFFQTDLSGSILTISPSVEKVFGFLPEELVGNPIPVENYFPEDRAILEDILKKNNEITDFEIRLLSKTGKIVYSSVNVHVIFDDKHIPIGVEGTLRDISVRKEAEQALYRQLSFAHALNHLAQVIIGIDDQNRILESMAKIAGETLQVDRSLIYAVDLKHQVGKGLCEWLNPNSKNVNPTKADYPLNLFRNAEKYASRTRHWLESHANAINPLFLKDGSASLLHEQMQIKSLFWFPLAFGPDGYFLLVFNQVTRFHKWQTEEIDFIKSIARLVEIAIMKIQMLKSQQKSATKIKQLATVVEQSSEAVMITDLDAHIEYVNAAFTKITGFESAEIMGKNPRFLQSGRQSPQFFKAIWEIIRAGKVWSGKYINKRKDQTIYNEQAIIFPLKDTEGKLIKYCKIARDITREEELESRLIQAQKLEALGTLAGGIAHDFNNMLMIISGRASLGLMTLDRSDLYEQTLKSILSAAKKAASTTQRLLSFSRKQSVNPVSLNLNTVISEMDDMLTGIIGNQIVIKLHLSDQSMMIYADKSQIEQILINLIINARDAIMQNKDSGRKKRIVIETGKMFLEQKYVSEHPGSKAGEYVFFSIRDNGSGMNEKVKTRIFEPFYTTKKVGQGTGLGLATVYGTVSQNKGFITVDSEPGQGTTFTIYWPAEAESVEKRE